MDNNLSMLTLSLLWGLFWVTACLPIHFPKGVLCLDVFNIQSLSPGNALKSCLCFHSDTDAFGFWPHMPCCLLFLLISTMPAPLSLSLKPLLTAYYVQGPMFTLSQWPSLSKGILTENSYIGDFVRTAKCLSWRYQQCSWMSTLNSSILGAALDFRLHIFWECTCSVGPTSTAMMSFCLLKSGLHNGVVILGLLCTDLNIIHNLSLQCQNADTSET